MSTYKGVLIEQSLMRPSRDLIQEDWIRKRYQIAFPDPSLIDIVEFEVPETEVLELAFKLSRELLPKRFYLHFIDGENMYVVYPHCVCLAVRGDVQSEWHAQAVGSLFDIPASQMRFEEIFVVEHPDLGA